MSRFGCPATIRIGGGGQAEHRDQDMRLSEVRHDEADLWRHQNARVCFIVADPDGASSYCFRPTPEAVNIGLFGQMTTEPLLSCLMLVDWEANASMSHGVLASGKPLGKRVMCSIDLYIDMPMHSFRHTFMDVVKQMHADCHIARYGPGA